MFTTQEVELFGLAVCFVSFFWRTWRMGEGRRMKKLNKFDFLVINKRMNGNWLNCICL